MAAHLARFALFVTIVSLLSRTASASSSGDAATVTALDEKWAAAEVAHDKAFLESILDDRFLGTDERGNTEGKAQFIDDVLRDTTMKSQRLVHDEVHVYNDSAVLLDTDTARIVNNGKSQCLVAKITVVYVKRDGSWRAAAEQFSIMPKKEHVVC